MAGAVIDLWKSTMKSTTANQHPDRLFQVMPPLPAYEQEALENSIRENGVLAPIIVDENGNIIDGYHRAEIAKRLGKPIRKQLRKFPDDTARRTAAYELNTARRTLTQDQKRQLVAQSLASDPQLSDRQHARRCGVSPTTVGTVRANLEETGDVSKLDTRTDSSGREQPASKPTTHAEETPPGGPTDSTPGQTDRVTEALKNARNRTQPDTASTADTKQPAKPKPKPKPKPNPEPKPKPEPEVIDWESLPPKVREREAVMRRVIRKEVEKEWKPEMDRLVQIRVEMQLATYLAKGRAMEREAERVLRTRDGIFAKADYDLIRSCLHPDSRLSVSEEKLATAFRLFSEADRVLLKDAEGT